MSNEAHVAPEQDVAVSSRVRLARNFEDIPFAPMMTREYARETIRRTSDAVNASEQGAAYRLTTLAEIPEDERKMLVEHHLISYDLLKYAEFSAALISTGETVSIMVNEEDHLRIQGLLPGMQLERAAELAFGMDDAIGKDNHFAFDPKWGYLASCPTNTGTGMRASVMLHLPALAATGQMPAVMQLVAKLGLTVRGLYGEGSEAQGHMYQLSNQVTLGRTEEDMIKSLMAVATQIISREREQREKWMNTDLTAFTDKMARSVGILMNARLMGLKEFMEKYSDLRLSVCMGIFDAPLAEIDRLMMDMQPASLAVEAQQELDARQVEFKRAEKLRMCLSKMIGEKKEK